VASTRAKVAAGAVALVIVGGAIAIGINSSNNSPSAPLQSTGKGGKGLFKRQGFATNCLWWDAVNGLDRWGGVDHAGRNPPTPGKFNSSCLKPQYDKSVTTAPQMLLNGSPAPAKIVYTYYLAPNNPTTTVEPPPPGLTMKGTQHYFTCSGAANRRFKAPTNCSTFSPLPDGTLSRQNAWVTFPNCWDGRTGTAYKVSGACPSGFSHEIPVLQFQFTWDVQDGTNATFSAGDASTWYATWANGWYQPALNALTRDCVTTPTTCGSILNYFNRSPLPT
jgi:hypothetical protein